MANEVTRRNPAAMDDTYGDNARSSIPDTLPAGNNSQQMSGGGRGEPRESLVDILERVLDKGVVIAGDISINLLDIELLTIKIRLLIASVDKAKEMGIDWWERDPQLSGKSRNGDISGSKHRGDRSKHMTDPNGAGDASLKQENQELRDRMKQLESKLETLLDRGLPGPRGKVTSTARPRGAGRRK